MSRVLIIGGTGMLGQALLAAAPKRGHVVTVAARTGGDVSLDVRRREQIEAVVGELRPAVVVNCAAITDLAACEVDPAAAYETNAAPLAALAGLSAAAGFRLVQVSTDHYWTGDGRTPHDENAAPRVVNHYAATKLVGEWFAREAEGALVLRTNIVGFRGWKQPTFAEWAIGALQAGEPLNLFEDFLTSSLDVASFAAAALDLIELEASGLINVASRQVSSKREFVEALAAEMGLPLPPVTAGSVKGLRPRRAESLGLDVSRAEGLLGRRLPDLPATVRTLNREYRERQ